MWLKFWGNTEQIEKIKALAGVKSVEQKEGYWIIFCSDPQEIKQKIDKLLGE